MMDARVWTFDGADHPLVEIAELLSTESGGAATDSGDFDVGAVLDVWHWCVGPLEICEIVYAIDNFFVVWG